jgi:hypothetical protein
MGATEELAVAQAPTAACAHDDHTVGEAGDDAEVADQENGYPPLVGELLRRSSPVPARGRRVRWSARRQ